MASRIVSSVFRGVSRSRFGSLAGPTTQVRTLAEKTAVPDGARHREIDLDFAQLQKLVEANPSSYMLIDVRQPWEVEERGRLPRSMNLPLGEIEAAMALPEAEFERRYGFPRLTCSGEHVVVYCCRGYRATEAKEKFRRLGLDCVRVFAGYLDYVEHGGLVDRSTEFHSPQA